MVSAWQATLSKAAAYTAFKNLGTSKLPTQMTETDQFPNKPVYHQGGGLGVQHISKTVNPLRRAPRVPGAADTTIQSEHQVTDLLSFRGELIQSITGGGGSENGNNPTACSFSKFSIAKKDQKLLPEK